MEEFLGFPLLLHLLYLLTKETIIRLARQGRILHPMFVMEFAVAWAKHLVLLHFTLVARVQILSSKNAYVSGC
jgi:hypothetical protein